MAPQAFFLRADKGQRFCIYHASMAPRQRGAVLYIPPFAEEMNCARRMAALQSRALAQAGFDVLQIDLLGCGDSSGDFADALWSHWVADVLLGARWLLQRPGLATGSHAPCLWLWGLRAGCLLAQQAVKQLGLPCKLLFWQPCSSGKAVLQQYLRLHWAAALLNDRPTKGSTPLLLQLQHGHDIEVAGYRITAALAQGLLAASLQPPAADSPVQHTVWLELSGQQPPTLSPLPAAWQGARSRLQRQALFGAAFWQQNDTPEHNVLLQASTAALCALAH